MELQKLGGRSGHARVRFFGTTLALEKAAELRSRVFISESFEIFRVQGQLLRAESRMTCRLP